MKFYSVIEYDWGDYSQHHGYFQQKDNAMKAAIKAVDAIQKEILEMRAFDKHTKEMYAQDIVQCTLGDTEGDHSIIWKSHHNEIRLSVVETQD